jgi:hypothetical protein
MGMGFSYACDEVAPTSALGEEMRVLARGPARGDTRGVLRQGALDGCLESASQRERRRRMTCKVCCLTCSSTDGSKRPTGPMSQLIMMLHRMFMSSVSVE